jgi:sulfide dehydrogenase [flavocytochrome c] flavoprotein subunit
VTFESQKLRGVHVIGDASIAGAMPKSGFSANSQAKVCAAAIVSMMKGEQPVSPSFANTCYSLVTPNYSISVAAVYRYTEGKISGVAGAGGVSPKDADAAARAQEAVYAQGWYDSITQDMFA